MSQRLIDEEGRECSKCGEYKPWADFNSHPNRTNGHYSRCKKCKNEQVREYRQSERNDYGTNKVRRMAHGNWYLVLRDPSECRPFLGRQIDALSLEYSLKSGHMPENMLLQHIAWGEAQGLHVVRGKSLKRQWLEAVE